jgi:hypothetical protein
LKLPIGPDVGRPGEAAAVRIILSIEALRITA